MTINHESSISLINYSKKAAWQECFHLTWNMDFVRFVHVFILRYNFPISVMTMHYLFLLDQLVSQNASTCS